MLACSARRWADLCADGLGRCLVVASDHDEADACNPAQADGPPDLRPGRVMHPHHTYQGQACLILLTDLQATSNSLSVAFGLAAMQKTGVLTYAKCWHVGQELA